VENINQSVRLCIECRTIDASFPLRLDCKSCAEMISRDEYMFWNSTVSWEDEEDLIPLNLLQLTFIQPLRAFFNLISLS
jgi:hypothetical protein